MTLATFIAAPPPGTMLTARLFAVVGLASLPLVRSDARFWIVLTVLAAIGTLSEPLLQLDNHHILQIYWLLAVSLSCLATDPRLALRRSARLVVGLVFAFATLWKIVVPDFADGSLLTYVVAVDAGVSEVVEVLGWQDRAVTEANQRTIGALRSDTSPPEGTFELHVEERLKPLLRLLAIVTIALEAAVAVTFLLPLPRRLRWLRDATLLTFLSTTYAILPVVGFAWLLITMGLTQSDLEEDRGSALYLAALLLIVVFAVRSQILGFLGLAAT